MKIGLISDTHGYLDEKVFRYFEACDEIWHAGDIGDAGVSRKLKDFRPLRAVYGNIDGVELRNIYPEDLWFECGGLQVWITHIGGTPPRYNPRVLRKLRERAPDIFICGHSHILRVKRDEKFNNMLFINPGAAGNQGFHPIKTILRFEIADGTVDKMEAVELGKRRAIS